MWSSHTPDDKYYQKIIAEWYEQFRDCLYVAMSILKNQALAEDAVHECVRRC